MIKINCKDVEQTKKLGAAIGRVLRGGEVFELKSDLGGGKTTFTKGLAVGMGVADVVQSPTFTISFIHKAARDLELHHFDFYRLQDAGIMNEELKESLNQPNTVVVIEWGDIVHKILPGDLISVTLRVQNDESRDIEFEIPENFDYITNAVKKFNNDSHN
ncbi:MAG TPA: tRNA (adenosine(37)-N6)-threonylcarbamoyltransferase complex ATPase subunit type 1 TsaE [Candidatus Saccharimonadales bacterium]|nr:tRNA (adenosine(37)-N6)-threonylcarbamoyltransferase complex ATPase subunit type 1 TsaE [Candidatus Saccharimonadales bacterium]